MDIWKKLYEAARETLNVWTVSPFIESGGVAAAVLTKAGNIYRGVCINTAASLGMCAERNAMACMITHGESRIDKILAVMRDSKIGPPCCVCRTGTFSFSLLVFTAQSGHSPTIGGPAP